MQTCLQYDTDLVVNSATDAFDAAATGKTPVEKNSALIKQVVAAYSLPNVALGDSVDGVLWNLSAQTRQFRCGTFASHFYLCLLKDFPRPLPPDPPRPDLLIGVNALRRAIFCLEVSNDKLSLYVDMKGQEA